LILWQFFPGGKMQPKRQLILIFPALIAMMLMVPSCTKKVTQPAPAVQAPEKQPATEAAEQEQEQLKKEAQERELRAAKIKFMYEDIYFKKGSYTLDPEAGEILMRKAEWLHNHPDIKVIIEGHTNDRGSKESNFALGDRRAGEVKSFLIRQGIAPERLIAESYGNEKPIDTAKTPAAQAKNRRVHFVVE
jgi:peptidoglycan-associated lipoprotein